MNIVACMADNNELVTIPEAMKLLGLSKNQFYRSRTRDDFPKLRHDYTNKHVDSLRRKTAKAVYLKAELEEWKSKSIKQN